MEGHEAMLKALDEQRRSEEIQNYQRRILELEGKCDMTLGIIKGLVELWLAANQPPARYT